MEKQIAAKREHLEDVTSRKRDAESKLAAMAKEAGVPDATLIPDAIECAAST